LYFTDGKTFRRRLTQPLVHSPPRKPRATLPSDLSIVELQNSSKKPTIAGGGAQVSKYLTPACGAAQQAGQAHVGSSVAAAGSVSSPAQDLTKQAGSYTVPRSTVQRVNYAR